MLDGKVLVCTMIPNGFIDIKDKNGNIKRRLNLSVCMDLDIVNLMKWEDDRNRESDKSYYNRFALFYAYFQDIHRHFNHDNLSISVNGGDSIKPDRRIINQSEIQQTHETKIQQAIWNFVFPPIKYTNGFANIGSLSIIKSPTKYPPFSSLNEHFVQLNKHSSKENLLSNFFRETTKTSGVHRKLSQISDNEFHSQILKRKIGVNSSFQKYETNSSIDIKKEAIKELINYKEINIKKYLDEFIDPEEFVNTFVALNKNLALKKLLGLVLEIQIDIPSTDPFELKFSPFTFGGYWSYIKTNIKRIQNKTGTKTAYILDSENKKDPQRLPEQDSYFIKTVLNTNKLIPKLKDDGTAAVGDDGNPVLFNPIEILFFDKLAQENKLQSQKEKIDRDEFVSDSEKSDSFTRGIIVYHHDLKKIIEQVNYEREAVSFETFDKKEDGTNVRINGTNINENSGVSNDIFVHGHRVAVRRFDPKTKSTIPFTSLTSRSVSVLLNNTRIFFNPYEEGVIHFDSVANTIDDNGNIKGTTSDVVFEWSGQQLSLKSAFSSSKKTSKLQKINDAIENPNSDGLQKSQIKNSSHLLVDSFPYEQMSNNPLNANTPVKILYGLPQIKDKKVPRLIVGNQYEFIVYQEYKNGWGLPLDTDKQNPAQLSIADLIDSGEIKPTEKSEFYILENKKPVLLFHKKEVKEEDFESKDISDPTKQAPIPLSERESLEHLVVRSNNLYDNDETIAERHVLPERISLEHAFWYNLLFVNMTVDETFKWKRKYNCQYHTGENYDALVNEKDKKGKSKGNKCSEGCTKYCGGTQMEKFYADSHMRPNFLTDPTVKGFIIKLFWDKECKNLPVKVNDGFASKTVSFDGTPGTNPKSYLLQVKGAKDEVYIEDHDWLDKIQVYLKKGINVYAQLTNDLFRDKEGKADNSKAWYDSTELYQKLHQIKVGVLEQQLNRNPPKIITLTHAVKEPLITPEIFNLASTPDDHRQIEHISNWLAEEEYQPYKIGKNIVAKRININNPANSPINFSYSKLELVSHFERLDAIDKIHFLLDVIPTGALELWMRKEEYIDDPDQIVLNPKSRNYNPKTTHQPDEPIVSFESADNKFSLEYKIEFTKEMIAQLKDLKRVVDIESINNVFRSLITKLSLEYDLKTTKFEEREYFLKDISKYKGFFTNEKFTDDKNSMAIDKLEEYALPKLENVMKNLGENSNLRFKVMVLNNKQPDKPEVTYAITTIQETRSYPESKKTTSTQKGNIVTIYLKRGRCSSGKDERIGIIVDADSLYNKVFKDNDLISKAGRDIVSDKFSNRSQFLQYGDIVIPEINEYKVGYDNELGIYHFLPKIDAEKQLWKVEVELDIKTKNGKQLHNPFINFSLIHFQPFSINYNDKNADTNLLELKNDCRISDVENSTWCYLLPERKLSVFFDKPQWLGDEWGYVDLTVSFDYESLHHFNYQDPVNKESKWKIRSNFILTVEGSDDNIIWHPVNSQLNNTDLKAPWGFNHALLTSDILNNEENLASLKLRFEKSSNPSYKVMVVNEHTGKEELYETNRLYGNKPSFNYSFFRVRFIEVEWFNDNLVRDFDVSNSEFVYNEPLDDETLRVRYVELIY